MAHNFQPGNYTGRLSYSGPSGQFTVTITRVTPSMVFLAPTVGQPAQGRRVHTNPATGSQFFYPLGRYSMAPTISLSNRNGGQ